MDGMEWVRAQNRRRYYQRIARLKADGEYEAFKAKKSQEGLMVPCLPRRKARRDSKQKSRVEQKVDAENER